ncbi:MAG: peptidyl-prolyl cis-trans isomerase [Pirellulales bacterium]
MAGTDANAPRSSRRTVLSLFFFGAAVLGVTAGVRSWWSAESANAAPPAKAAPAGPPKTAEKSAPQIVALVNGEEISRQQLAQECLRYGGEDVLESIVNRHLIAIHCEQQKIVVSDKEVRDEIARMAARFNLGVDQWLKMLETERQISPQQYSRDIVWPTLALRKLAGPQLQVTEEEIKQEYETEYGPAVKARIIVVKDPRKAAEIRAQAVAPQADFARLARSASEDVNTASTGGLVQPIRRHMGDPQLEEVAFRLKEGEVGPILKVGDQHVILKCEGHLAGRDMAPAQVRERHIDQIRDRKLPKVASELFRKLQTEAKVENVMNDPAKRQSGIAAQINGHPITLRELSEECITRQGKEVLDTFINRKLLEQRLREKKLVVTQPEIDAEIARAAVANDILLPNRQPDVQKWLSMVTQQSGVTVDAYVRDAVWPTVALKKLVSEGVKITDEDLQKGFEANYGPRVRCRAIVLGDQRLAQQVWDMARKDARPENFAQLASEYSIEIGSRSQGGEVPPLQKHGGQPVLENEAFRLKPGEISGVIQVGDKYVILRSEGFTKPEPVQFAEVRQLLFDDIHEKKLRVAMAQEFERIKSSSQIDNFLAGTTQSPKKPAPGLDPTAPRVSRAPSGAVQPAGATRPVTR